VWEDTCHYATGTFSIYQGENDTVPLWQENQTFGANDYSFPGATTNGVPTDIFSNGSARWLELVCDGNVYTRIPLAASPYAISAVDSANLGGRPASDYALVSQLGSTTSSSALSNEISRSQQAEADLAQQITTEVNIRQSTAATMQLNEVATASQMASLNSAIVALQSQIAALQNSNTALAAQLVSLTGMQSATIEQTDVHSISTAQIHTSIVPGLTTAAAVTPSPASPDTAGTTPRIGRSSRIGASIQ
jgi:hypothetical protein